MILSQGAFGIDSKFVFQWQVSSPNDFHRFFGQCPVLSSKHNQLEFEALVQDEELCALAQKTKILV